MQRIAEKQFPLNDERIKYVGRADFINSFMLKEQLYDKTLWKIFVDQFRERKDGEKGTWLGEFFGKMMRGACLTYQYTRDEKLLTILENAVEDFLTTQDELGRFSTYTTEKEFTGWDMWGRKYAMLGLEYFYEISDNEGLKKRIVTALEKHADYIVENVGEGKKHPIAYAVSFWQHAGLPSCSILEPFVKLYKLTGKQAYLKYAEAIVKTGFTNNEDDLVEIFYKKQKRIPELISKKGYEMMSCFQGLLEYYEVVGEEKYLTALCNFVDAVVETELTEIGGLGTDYEFFDDSVKNQIYYKDKPMLETCVTVTFMNLCYRMLQFTGDSRFADYIERSAYNAMFGAVNTEKNQTSFKWNEGGPQLIETHYFLPIDSYSPLARQRRAVDVGGCLTLREDGMKYGCCTCISSAGTAISALYGIMKTENGYVINGYEEGHAKLFSPSGMAFDLKIAGKPFENDEAIKISLSMQEKEDLRFLLRIPKWSKKTTVRCKGKQYTPKAGGYLEICESFEDGDEIEVITDTKIYAICQGNKVLLKKCAYVLARDERYEDGFDEAVQIPILEGGRVNGRKACVGKFNALAEFSVPLENGKSILLCDYSSAGKKWDKGVNLRVSVWL
ncbi:MAG: glycoside hydrolase family 127 protein [Clostridia bacterium]|nr:glycoside hydrolase family 127 protein [Clostridia bacterium]